MPIYEYQCKRCDHRFELIQKFADPPRKRCPECRGAVERLISSPAIRFKGTGWYVTDYADKKKGREKDDDKPPADAKGGDEAKAEGKKSDKKSGGTKKSGNADD